MIDTFQELKLKLLKFNLNQNWTLPNEIWNEEIPHDYMYEDTYLQLSFVFNTFTQNELLKLIKVTNDEIIILSQEQSDIFWEDTRNLKVFSALKKNLIWKT